MDDKTEDKKKFDINNLSKEDSSRLFKDMLRKAGVTSTWKWEDCERVLYNEEIWKLIRKYKDKKALVEEFIKECKTREREEQRLKKDRIKIKFRQMLEDDSQITSDTKYGDIISKYCYDERWRSLDERERDDIFQDYLDELEKRENEERRILRESKIRAFRKILEDKKLPIVTKWKDICLNLKDDALFNSMEKLDRLTAFREYITELVEKENSERESNKKFEEYKNRENFREFLNELIKRGEINSKSKWKTFVAKISGSDVYTILIGQPGSQPKDLFDDVVIILKDDYRRNKDNLKKILKTNSIKFLSDTTFDQFDDRLRSYYDYVNMKPEMKNTLWTHLIKKLKDKYINFKNRVKEHHKIEKKAMKKLKSYLKKKNPIILETKIEDRLEDIKSHSRFSFLTYDKIKYIFDKVKSIIESEANGEAAPDDTSSESDQIKKKKNKKKKKSKKRKRSNDSIELEKQIKKMRREENDESKMIIEKEDGEISI